jgi:hypothetical protein
MLGEIKLSPDYWKNFQVTQADIEQLHTTLFEREAPLTIQELVAALIEYRTQMEVKASDDKKQSLGRIYLPKDTYSLGEHLVFPTINWATGKVVDERAGTNPALDPFKVITVSMDDGNTRLFAASLTKHPLNDLPVKNPENNNESTEAIIRTHGQDIMKTLEASLETDESLVQIAGRWFPRSLLVDVNVGHLNLAEAVLDVSGGEPQPTSNLLKDVSLPEGINPKLAEFSLNLALQEDERFDEVGPAGEVLWCLRRLEPEYVREVPIWLRYIPIDHERSILTDPMRDLEAHLDDELSVRDFIPAADQINHVTISLIYPHLRAGTLPVSALAKKLFPTAYESPRVRFTMVDGRTKQKIPGWVVRKHGYVYGLREWYKAHQLIPGSLVDIKRSDRPGEVIIEARTQKAAKDWVRTLIIGADGGMVFALLKQPITAEFNDRMAIFVPDFKLLDPFWEKKHAFEDLVISVMRELTKLNPQGHVHAQELYAAINLIRRVPPAPLFALLEGRQAFNHVGDLHYRLVEEIA